MHNSEAIQMMQRCAAEIKNLRRQVDILAPKADAYDKLSAVIGMMPNRSGAYASEDLVWVIEKRIAEIEKEESAVNKVEPTTPSSGESP